MRRDARFRARFLTILPRSLLMADAPGPASPQVPWWRGAVIYQIYPRSFADSNADGVGDLPGITARLDYVASLGVDAIWLSPFFASPMKDFGYDVSDYRAVDPLFGTMADFDALLSKAHDLGLKVVIDQVYAHTSDQHPWFLQSRTDRGNPRADWYVWGDPKPDGTAPNNWLSVFYGPAWTWDGRRGQYYMHNFLSAQPNLNVNNATVQDALLEEASFWLKRGVDGFRLDAINFAMHDPKLTDNPPVVQWVQEPSRPFDFQHHLYNQSQSELVGFITRLAKLVGEYSGFTVAEVGGEQALEERKRFTEGTARLDTSYGFDFLSAPKLTPSLILDTLGQWQGGMEEGWPSWAFSNHDAPRVVSRWGDGASDDWAKLCLMLLMCLRGNVFLYQGEELGLTQAEIPFDRLRDPEAIANWPATQGRDGARTPMPWSADQPHAGFSTAEPWLPIPEDHRLHAVAEQDGDAGSVLSLTRTLIELRRSNPALRLGGFRPLDLPAPLLGFERGEGAGRLACLFNLGKTSLNCPPLRQGRVLVGCGTVEADAGRLGPLAAAIVEYLTV